MSMKKLSLPTNRGFRLTMQIQRILGTRGNFGIVLPVRSCGAVGFVARCQGRPRRS